MRLRLRCVAALLAVPLGGCLGDAPINAGGDVLPHTAPEHLEAPVPDGWHGVHVVSSKEVAAEEYVPSGETRENFTQMMTVAWMPRGEYPTLAAAAETLGVNMTKFCGVPPVMSEPHRYTDNGYAATDQSLRCGKSPAGFGHAMVVKTIKGGSAYFQVQRAWRTPAVATSDGVVVADAAMQAAMAELGNVHLCNDADKAMACGP